MPINLAIITSTYTYWVVAMATIAAKALLALALTVALCASSAVGCAQVYTRRGLIEVSRQLPEIL
jgi:hypothetical protein